MTIVLRLYEAMSTALQYTISHATEAIINSRNVAHASAFSIQDSLTNVKRVDRKRLKNEKVGLSEVVSH
jgi:hypothetical protein